MSHTIQAILGARSVLSHAASLGLSAEVQPLDVGMGWIAVTDAVLDHLTERLERAAAPDARFARLGWGLPELLVELSAHGPVAYVETEYVGQVGEQAATVYVSGRRSVESCRVNEALRAIGVVARAGQDEWDTVGLGANRHMPGDDET